MKAIVVKYIPTTDSKPSRFRAKAEGVPSLTLSYDYNAPSPQRVVAQALCDKYGWQGELVEGTLPNGDSVFVFVPSTFRHA